MLAGGAALTPEALRPKPLVAILHVCAWMLLVTGMFQIVVSKLGNFRFVSYLCMYRAPLNPLLWERSARDATRPHI